MNGTTPNVNKNSPFSRTSIRIIFGILLLLISARIALPYIVLPYVVQQINKIPDYKVRIADLDIYLIQGRYTLKNLELWKTTGKVPTPFIKSDAINFSIEWKALLKGKFVGEIEAQNPIINFVTEPNKSNEQLTIGQEWLGVVKSLFPLNINQVIIHNGVIYLKSFQGNPPFSLYLKNIEFQLNNMQNAERIKEGMLSTINLTAKAMDNAPMVINGKLDPFASKPTFYLTLSVKSLSLREINSFLKYYTNVKAKSGKFSLYMEMAAANGEITGYAKPFLTNLTVDTMEKGGALHQLYTGAVSIAAKIIQNPQQKSVATKVNFKGNIEDPNISILSLIFYFFHHGFIQALVPQLDQKVSMQDMSTLQINRIN